MALAAVRFRPGRFRRRRGGLAPGLEWRDTGVMAETKHPKQKEEKPAAPPKSESDAYRAHVPADIRNVTFPVGMRGYERNAVEAYVRRVNRVIAELEVTRSPQAAVKHAVERVSEQTKTILEEARESAEKITTTAQTEADVVAASSEADRVKAESDELVAHSKEQADQIIAEAKANAEQRRRESEQELAKAQAEAEARMRELEADTASVWDRRHELLGDIDRMADQLHEAARQATG